MTLIPSVAFRRGFDVCFFAKLRPFMATVLANVCVAELLLFDDHWLIRFVQ